MEADDAARWRQLLERKPDSHKYDYGQVLVVGGSPGMVGAPLLAAMAALRTGAGLATIASAPDVVDKLEKRVVEVMTYRLAEKVGPLVEFIQARHVKAMVIGPGLTTESLDFVKSLLPDVEVPVMLDAGAMAAHEKAKQAILTPHQGELEKLVGKPIPKDRPAFVTELAEKWQKVIVLKGRHTIVAAPQGEMYTNHTGNPGMATAGTGDVLTGVIAGLLGQGVELFQAAKMGVYLHGLAGDLAAQHQTEPGMVASDVVDALPGAWQQLVTDITNG